MSGPAADVVMTANGPGEVAGWLYPVAERLRAYRAQGGGGSLRLWAWVPPCNFASGAEPGAVRALGAFDGVFDPPAMWRFLILGRLPEGFRPSGRGVVLFLGGDLFYAAAAARRLGYPAMAYTEGRARWHGTFERFFVPDPSAARRAMRMGASPERVEVVGDLVVDAVRDRLRRQRGGGATSRPPSEPVVGLFAGSRSFEVRWVLPLMVRAADIISREMGSRVRFVAIRSPFVGAGPFEEALAAAAAAGAPPVEVVDGDREAAMEGLSVAISVPGTVTAELGALGVPTVTVLPLHRPELIPLEGLPGVVGSLPLLGPAVKRQVVRRAARRVGPLSLPARRAGRPMGPELVGAVTPEAVAAAALGLLRDEARRQELSRAIRQAMGPSGAADRIVARVLQRLGLPAPSAAARGLQREKRDVGS